MNGDIGGAAGGCGAPNSESAEPNGELSFAAGAPNAESWLNESKDVSCGAGAANGLTGGPTGGTGRLAEGASSIGVRALGMEPVWPRARRPGSRPLGSSRSKSSRGPAEPSPLGGASASVRAPPRAPPSEPASGSL